MRWRSKSRNTKRRWRTKGDGLGNARPYKKEKKRIAGGEGEPEGPPTSGDGDGIGGVGEAHNTRIVERRWRSKGKSHRSRWRSRGNRP